MKKANSRERKMSELILNEMKYKLMGSISFIDETEKVN